MAFDSQDAVFRYSHDESPVFFLQFNSIGNIRLDNECASKTICDDELNLVRIGLASLT